MLRTNRTEDKASLCCQVYFVITALHLMPNQTMQHTLITVLVLSLHRRSTVAVKRKTKAKNARPRKKNIAKYQNSWLIVLKRKPICLAFVIDGGYAPAKTNALPFLHPSCTDSELVDSADAGSKRSTSDLATAVDAKLQNDARERDADSAFCDASVIRLIASTARVVSTLCETRYHGMAHSNLSVAELGDFVDVRTLIHFLLVPVLSISFQNLSQERA